MVSEQEALKTQSFFAMMAQSRASTEFLLASHDITDEEVAVHLAELETTLARTKAILVELEEYLDRVKKHRLPRSH